MKQTTDDDAFGDEWHDPSKWGDAGPPPSGWFLLVVGGIWLGLTVWGIW